MGDKFEVHIVGENKDDIIKLNLKFKIIGKGSTGTLFISSLILIPLTIFCFSNFYDFISINGWNVDSINGLVGFLLGIFFIVIIGSTFVKESKEESKKNKENEKLFLGKIVNRLRYTESFEVNNNSVSRLSPK